MKTDAMKLEKMDAMKEEAMLLQISSSLYKFSAECLGSREISPRDTGESENSVNSSDERLLQGIWGSEMLSTIEVNDDRTSGKRGRGGHRAEVHRFGWSQDVKLYTKAPRNFRAPIISR